MNSKKGIPYSNFLKYCRGFIRRPVSEIDVYLLEDEYNELEELNVQGIYQ